MPKKAQTTREYPLDAPYSFEGFAAAFEVEQERVRQLAEREQLRDNWIGVFRHGDSEYGTFGHMNLWRESRLRVLGFTLEPRASVGKGPIPLGNYDFIRWMSPTLGKTLRLFDVPGFTDILVHVGNFQSETKGCILAAKRVDQEQRPTQLLDSRVFVDWLYDNFPFGTLLVKSL